jgi:hypothetical protein
VDRAAAHIRNCELVVGSCHRRNHDGGSGENHGHGCSRRHFLLNFAARLGGPYHSRRQVADILRRRGRPDLSRSSGQAPYAAAGGAKRCKRFGEAPLDRSFPMTDFRIRAANSDPGSRVRGSTVRPTAHIQCAGRRWLTGSMPRAAIRDRRACSQFRAVGQPSGSVPSAGRPRLRALSAVSDLQAQRLDRVVRGS